jgi:6-phosphogluconolactonase
MLTFTNADQKELATQAGDWVRDGIARLLETQPHVVLALPGGQSPTQLFRRLAQLATIDWSRVHIFMLDERLVSLDSPDSNYRQVQELLIDPLVEQGLLPPDNAHPFLYDSTAADLGVAAYTQELHALGGRFDMVIVGVGEDGHTAALFPNHAALYATTDFVTLDDSPKPPAKRLTSTPALLARTQMAMVLFIGETKREAYANWLNPNMEIAACPAKVFTAIADLAVVTDLSLT